ncbi:MAG: nucleotidyltransferase family protein [Gammaproteobacteria bacterium]
MNERTAEQRRRFEESLLANEFIVTLLERLQSSDLPEWSLSGGCLFQTVWNIEHGFDAAAGILDYDLFYFDPADTSAHAELMVREQLAQQFADLPIEVEVRNQARVHLWYEREFGAPCQAFRRCEDGIDGFLATCCCFSVRQAKNGERTIYSPHGFDDLFALTVRPNAARTINSRRLRGIYETKAQRWSRVWPRLQIVEWPSS